MKAKPSLSEEKKSSNVVNLFNSLGSLYKSNVAQNKEDDSEKNMNRVMLRQVIEREDVSRVLKKADKQWVLSKWQTGLIVFLVSATFLLLTKKIFLAVLFSWLVLCASVVFNMIKKGNIENELEDVLKKLAGSDSHYHVLTEMLRNTPYELVSNEKNSGWVFREMLNFKEMDDKFLVEENVKDNENSLKTDLLRNINK